MCDIDVLRDGEGGGRKPATGAFYRAAARAHAACDARTAASGRAVTGAGSIRDLASAAGIAYHGPAAHLTIRAHRAMHSMCGTTGGEAA